jgi:hypothetical protein
MMVPKPDEDGNPGVATRDEPVQGFGRPYKDG